MLKKPFEVQFGKADILNRLLLEASDNSVCLTSGYIESLVIWIGPLVTRNGQRGSHSGNMELTRERLALWEYGIDQREASTLVIWNGQGVAGTLVMWTDQ